MNHFGETHPDERPGYGSHAKLAGIAVVSTLALAGVLGPGGAQLIPDALELHATGEGIMQVGAGASLSEIGTAAIGAVLMNTFGMNADKAAFIAGLTGVGVSGLIGYCLTAAANPGTESWNTTDAGLTGSGMVAGAIIMGMLLTSWNPNENNSTNYDRFRSR